MGQAEGLASKTEYLKMGDLALWIIMLTVIFFIGPAICRIANALEKIANKYEP